jgi:hypothetical protein
MLLRTYRAKIADPISIISSQSYLGWYVPIFLKMFFDEHFAESQLEKHSHRGC